MNEAGRGWTVSRERHEAGRRGGKGRRGSGAELVEAGRVGAGRDGAGRSVALSADQPCFVHLMLFPVSISV